MAELPREAVLRPQLYQPHKTFGVLALGLVIRSAWTLLVGTPTLPRSLYSWEITSGR